MALGPIKSEVYLNCLPQTMGNKVQMATLRLPCWWPGSFLKTYFNPSLTWGSCEGYRWLTQAGCVHMQPQETTSGHLSTATCVDYVLGSGSAPPHPVHPNPLTGEGEEACSANKRKVRFQAL